MMQPPATDDASHHRSAFLRSSTPIAFVFIVVLTLLAVPAAALLAAPAGDDEPGAEIDAPEPCATTTTTTTTIAWVVYRRPVVTVPEDPCPEPDEATGPESSAPPTTAIPTTPAPQPIDAVDDQVSATQGRRLAPFDVTDNDTVSPSLQGISIVDGQLPDGLKLWVDNSLEGRIIGTPAECGTFAVDYRIEAAGAGDQDRAGLAADTATVTIEVACRFGSGPLQATDDLIDAVAGERIEFDLLDNDSPSAGIASLSTGSGAIPDGLTVWAGGWITGTTTETGVFEFTYTSNGRDGSTDTATVTITVS